MLLSDPGLQLVKCAGDAASRDVTGRWHAVPVAVPEWMRGDQVVHVDHRDASAGLVTEWPDWLPADCRDSILAAGIERPWVHQRTLADLAFSGRHSAICTSTASGKTLAYLLQVMAATASHTPELGVEDTSLRAQLTSRRRHSALYLAPTKALAHDQWRACRELGPEGWAVSALDGDSDHA